MKHPKLWVGILKGCMLRIKVKKKIDKSSQELYPSFKAYQFLS